MVREGRSQKRTVLAPTIFRLGLSTERGTTKSEVRTISLSKSMFNPCGENCSPKMSKVPATSSGTLAKVANLVNYYQLHETVELFSDTWIGHLEPDAWLKGCKPEALPWLFISWVFKKHDEFEKVSQVLIRESDDKLLDDLQDQDIPIPLSMSCEL